MPFTDTARLALILLLSFGLLACGGRDEDSGPADPTDVTDGTVSGTDSDPDVSDDSLVDSTDLPPTTEVPPTTAVPPTTDVNLEAVIEGPGDDDLYIGQLVEFDGSASTGPEGETLTHEWAIVARPDGSEAELSRQHADTTSFVPDVTGTYEIELTVSVGETEDSTTAEVDILPCLEPREVSGRIDEDVHWTALPGACPSYIVTGDIDLRAALTIDPGVVVRFGAGTQLLVNRRDDGGALQAEGTDDAPIVLEGTQAEPGWWQGVHIVHQHPLNRMDHVVLRHGGGGGVSAALRVGGGNFDDGDLRLTNSRIEESASLGLHANVRGTLTAFADNFFANNEEGPLRVDISQIGALDHGTSWGDDVVIEVTGDRIEDETAFLALAAPYHLLDGIEARAPVEVEPGAILRFASGTRLLVDRRDDGGALQAEGTADSPIILEGTRAEAGWWEGVYIVHQHALNRMDHVVLRHGGGGNVSAALRVGGDNFDDGDLRLTNTLIEESDALGLHVNSRGTLAAFADNAFEEVAENPARIHVSQMERLDAGTNWGEDAIIEIVGARIDDDLAVGDVGVPYLLLDGLDVRAALEVHPGTTFLMARDAQIVTGAGGYIEARGTADDRITFAGEDAQAGYWQGFHLAREGDRENAFDHVDFLHAGGGAEAVPAAVVAGVTGGTSSGRNTHATITNSHFDEIGDPNGDQAIALRTASEDRGSFNENVCTANTFGTIHGPVDCDYP